MPTQMLDANMHPIPGAFALGTNQVLSSSAAAANSSAVGSSTTLVRLVTTTAVHFTTGRAAAVKASGFIDFSGQPSPNDTITINGVVFTFKASGATGNEVDIGVDLAATLTATAAVLNASVNGSVSVATYSAVTGRLKVLHDTAGAAGNAFTLAKSGTNMTVTGSTLSGGADAAVATTSDPILPVDGEILLPITPGHRVSVIRVTADGKVSVTELK